MKKIDHLLEHYGESHQNATNKAIHWLCVPAIMFSLFGLLYALPFPFGKTIFGNWAVVFLAFSMLYYIRLSVPLFLALLVIGIGMIFGLDWLANIAGSDANLVKSSLAIFAAAWVIQFIGHKIEGKKPSFLEDVQYLLVGPMWLLHFIFKKFGISYV
jgi:uncharacterized membrane protein YGL010W